MSDEATADAEDGSAPEIALARAEIRLVRRVGRLNVVVGVFSLIALGAVQLLSLAGAAQFGPGLATIVWWPAVGLLNAGTFINNQPEVRPRLWLRHLVIAAACGVTDAGLSLLYLDSRQWVQALPLLPVAGAGVVNGWAVYRLRRVYPDLIAAGFEQASPPGSLPFARAAAPLAQTCALLSLTGILWFGAGMVWAGLALVDKTGPIDLPPLLNVAAVVGAIGGGVVQFSGGLLAMHGLNLRTRAVQRGLIFAAAGGPLAGAWLYFVATVAAPPGLTWWGSAAMIVPPLIVPALCGLTLALFHRVYATRAELTELLAQAPTAAAAHAETMARARALRTLLGEA